MLRLHPLLVQDPNEDGGDHEICQEGLELYSQYPVVSCVQIPNPSAAL
jgi:hypothetical protein